MANPRERVEQWWDGLQPRERSLVAILGGTAIVCILGFIGLVITDGLASIEAKNEMTRQALQSLHKHRIAKAKGLADKNMRTAIPTEAIDLEVYLGEVANEIGVKFPKYNRSETNHGNYTEATGRIELQDVTIADLAKFLQKIEEKPAVFVREIHVKHDFREKGKQLDVPELLVSTFYETGAAQEGGEE